MQDISKVTKQRIEEVLDTHKHTPYGSVEAVDAEYGLYRHTGAVEEEEQHLPLPNAPSFEAMMVILKERQESYKKTCRARKAEKAPCLSGGDESAPRALKTTCLGATMRHCSRA